MRIKLDENFPISAKAFLVHLGHCCHTVFDENIEGGPDDALIHICRDESRVLFTLDLDFADIITYPPDEYAGIIVFRLSQQSTSIVIQRLEEVMDDLQQLPIQNHLIIVNDSRIRYR
jgi:predicted nuclease of predicted toxin-antitoxin system